MPEKSGKIRQKNGPDILLGSGSVDPQILSRVIESFYGESVDADDDADADGRVDRRRYKGKHQMMSTSKPTKSDRSINSPMYIRLDSKKT